MGICSIYLIEKAKRPEGWPSLSGKLESMKIKPLPVYERDEMRRVLMDLCREYDEIIVLRISQGFYVIPNLKLSMPEEKEKALKDVTVKVLKARAEEVLVTSEKGLENFVNDLFEGKIKISEPWWIRKAKLFAIAVILLVVLLHFGVVSDEPSTGSSHKTHFLSKLVVILITLVIGIKRGYIK